MTLARSTTEYLQYAASQTKVSAINHRLQSVAHLLTARRAVVCVRVLGLAYTGRAAQRPHAFTIFDL
eukprot:6460255-Prymnesium_polylepis.1